ncbi:LysR family transcriptional regulator [Curvibacter sp. HBC61]|uniref:LysR family transcriptional regulator n=1 Tax=Curvibacter cyanobacteriorum TaxID=3026422 RepID=A0ABT5MXV6_9BURK|nr:LysR family transcriptional regulator [Curvibacter sp. HBC61]MDD0838875.1 LysR family transcriptional regulator [Curvibacter sp. HBC61]
MRFNKLDLNLLVALNAMLSTCSISRAAERLHMSQSAMSNALARLREYFDDELLVQVGRQMELTPRAEVLKEAVRDVLMRVDTTITAQPEFDPARSEREFRIFVSDYSLSTLMPQLMVLAHAQAPRVRFHLMPQVEQPQRALEQGQADLLVIPKEFCSPDHPTDTVFQDEFVCAVCNQGRFRDRELTPDSYLAAGHVIMQPPAGGQSLESAFMLRHGIARRVEVSTFSFMTAPHLVVGTDRIATMHRRLAQQASRHLPIRLLKPPMPIPPMVQVMQWHKHRSKDPGLLWLRQTLLAAAARMDEATTA